MLFESKPLARTAPRAAGALIALVGLSWAGAAAAQVVPYFKNQSMDVAIVDTPWNGVWQSLKIAQVAEAFEVNVAPHNFYGHLCTMMNAHFSAAVPNLRIMETDIDRILGHILDVARDQAAELRLHRCSDDSRNSQGGQRPNH